MRRAGFTMIEVFIVIAIIAVLIGMLLPAVQKVREAAYRLTCTHKLTQIALAMHNYQDAFGSLPAGSLNAAPSKYVNYAGWATLILPFLEQHDLYRQYDLTKFNWDAANQGVLDVQVKAFTCPSDHTTDQLVQLPDENYSSPVAPGSYKGVAGRYSEQMGVFWDYAPYLVLYPNFGLSPVTRGPLHAVATGAGPKAVRYVDITDGLSNTFLVGEYSTQTGPESKAFWAVSWAYYALGSCGPYAAVRGLPDYEACVAELSPVYCRRAFASPHVGGMNFVMCDGHVQFIATTIDADVYMNLATIAGGEAGLAF
jgi:prepilin-type N-terminal cleavage/methylation domain-containing protein/prepilin-type processing-associated H-X9-DG protein